MEAFRISAISIFSALFIMIAANGCAKKEEVKHLDKKEVEAIISEYIRSHPQEILAATKKLEQEQRAAQEEAQLRQALANRVDVPSGDSPSHGPADASITIVEFSDFQCPYCARSLGTVATLMERHKGKARLLFKHNPLDFHKQAPLAHKASIAADKQGKFWEYRQQLMSSQSEWGQAADSRGKLIEYAKELNMDVAKFEADMDNPESQENLDNDLALGAKLGVQGTPTYFINGVKVVGARDLAHFEKVIATIAAIDK